MSEVDWFMGAWATFCELGALRGKSSAKTSQLVLELSKRGIALWFFSSAKQEILRKGYTVMESLSDHMSVSSLRCA